MNNINKLKCTLKTNLYAESQISCHNVDPVCCMKNVDVPFNSVQNSESADCAIKIILI